MIIHKPFLAVDFFNQINILYGSISDYCTPKNKTCEVMSAGPQYEYLWADGENIKKPIKVSAPEYVDYLMTWVQSILDDETVFPSRVGMCCLINYFDFYLFNILLCFMNDYLDVPFPKNFKDIVKNIFKRLFRVYAHIYYR